MFNLIAIFFIINQSFSNEIDVNKYFGSFRQAALDSRSVHGEYLERLNKVIIRNANIDEIQEHLAARCDSKQNIVLINYHAFVIKSELAKQEIIDHELGHCVLLRSHHNESIYTHNGEEPTNIMHYIIFPYKSVFQMKEYRKGLFKQEFYGTLKTIEERFSKLKLQDEVVVMNGFLKYSEGNNQKNREIEHSVMQERINLFIKNK